MGGQLQVLHLADKRSADMRYWSPSDRINVGQKLIVEWIDIDDVTSPADYLRYRGFERGAARFARGEGIWYMRGELYFACISGGFGRKGQIWRYVPWPSPEKSRPNRGGTLELFVEPNDSRLLESADNLTVAPWGDLFVCEDRQGDAVRIVGITDDGQFYTLANSHSRSELAGVTFSPDGSTLFVNVQHAGLTLAVVGPW